MSPLNGRLFSPTADAATILAAGPQAAQAHHDLASAVDTLNAVRDLRVTVADMAGGAAQDVSQYIDGADTPISLKPHGGSLPGSGSASTI